ncbi:hypothetical protein [Nostoc sp. DedSLP04]|uniref:hypothetical protein n=1 Tax=Nostoc sp. DedSLP04 TaxID=3075401 RepID=UPI002AD3C6DA|nr:hypothetical protein [Nostoc sp. DedSLP04]MDZ8035165.1 hypothetical protein [Nostoc sp. DedSLP04]
MIRSNADKSNLVNVTVRVESQCLNDLKLYSRVVGKNTSEILRELVSSALDAIPEHQRQAMEIIAKCETSP